MENFKSPSLSLTHSLSLQFVFSLTEILLRERILFGKSLLFSWPAQTDSWRPGTFESGLILTPWSHVIDRSLPDPIESYKGLGRLCLTRLFAAGRPTGSRPWPTGYNLVPTRGLRRPEWPRPAWVCRSEMKCLMKQKRSGGVSGGEKWRFKESWYVLFKKILHVSQDLVGVIMQDSLNFIRSHIIA